MMNRIEEEDPFAKSAPEAGYRGQAGGAAGEKHRTSNADVEERTTYYSKVQ
jgi:hypothetical protein